MAVALVLASHIVIAAVLSGDLSGHVHRWLSFMTAFFLFLYIVRMILSAENNKTRFLSLLEEERQKEMNIQLP